MRDEAARHGSLAGSRAAARHDVAQPSPSKGLDVTAHSQAWSIEAESEQRPRRKAAHRSLIRIKVSSPQRNGSIPLKYGFEHNPESTLLDAAEQEVQQLRAQVEQLKAENQRLKPLFTAQIKQLTAENQRLLSLKTSTANSGPEEGTAGIQGRTKAKIRMENEGREHQSHEVQNRSAKDRRASEEFQRLRTAFVHATALVQLQRKILSDKMEPAQVPPENARQKNRRQRVHAAMDSAALREMLERKTDSEKDATNDKPDGLDAFTPLLDDARIKELAKKLHSLELEFARSSESDHEEKGAAFGVFSSAQAALRIEVKAFTSEVQAKITQRTKGLREAPPEEELEGKWTELIDVVLQEDDEEEKVNVMRAQWEKSSPWDKHRILIGTRIRLGHDDQIGLELIYECANAILSDINDDFQHVYESVHAYVIDSEKQHLGSYNAAIERLQKAVRGDPTQLRQREEAAEVVTLLADAAVAKPWFDAVMQEISDVTGARLEMSWCGKEDEKDGDRIVHTGLKATKRIIEKAELRFGEGRGRTDRVCDVVRAMLVAKDMAMVRAIVDVLLELIKAGVIKVVRIKDRFKTPSAGGWRDLMVNLVVLKGGGENTVQHICEVQVVHEMMLTSRKGLSGHGVYRKVRNAIELIESCGLENELRLAMVQILRKKGATDREILQRFEDGWILEDADWVEEVGDRQALREALRAGADGRLAKVSIRLNEILTSLPEGIGECVALQTLELHGCSSLRSLPEGLRKCKALQKLSLSGCEDLEMLPERLGECKELRELDLNLCTGLISLPDLSGLVHLQIYGLPDDMKPWEEGGRKFYLSRSARNSIEGLRMQGKHPQAFKEGAVLRKQKSAATRIQADWRSRTL